MNTFFQKYATVVKDKVFPALFAFLKSNKLKAVTVSTLCIVLASVLTGISVATNVLYINDGNTTQVVYTMKDDVEEIIKGQGISLTADDTIKFDGFNEKNIGTVEIMRAFQVPVTADGETKTVAVTEATVADVLKLAGITLSEDDLINVGLNEKVHADTEIEVNRVTYRTVNKTTAIPFNVNKRETITVRKGTSKIAAAGKEGVRMTVSKEKLVDGEVVESEIVSETVQKNPIAQLLLIGTAPRNSISKLTPPSSLKLNSKGVPTSYVKKVTGKAVAYSTRNKRTKLKQGNVAVDYRKFPKGSKLWICTPDQKFVYGYAVAADTGAFARDPKSSVLVDLFFESYSDTLKWGAKQVDIYVLK